MKIASIIVTHSSINRLDVGHRQWEKQARDKCIIVVSFIGLLPQRERVKLGERCERKTSAMNEAVPGSYVNDVENYFNFLFLVYDQEDCSCYDTCLIRRQCENSGRHCPPNPFSRVDNKTLSVND